MSGLVHRQNAEKRLEKQIGCMSSFLQIFNRQQILARKRIHSAKRLNSSEDVGDSPECSQELGKPVESANQSRPPGVIAKLMGLEPLLPRSASESRGSRDHLGHPKHINCNNFQLKQPNQPQKQSKSKSMMAMHADFEKRLKIRGVDQQLNDLNTLKQILEVLQLKGLLHSTNDRRNLHSDESSVHLKQWRSLASKVEQHIRSRTVSPNRIQCNLKSCNSISERKPLSIEIVDIAPCTTDLERSRWEDCRDPVHSIAEMNRTTESLPSSVTILPSPVSVLDSGFDKDESWSPSHSIDFKATSTVDFDEENCSPKISPTEEQEEFISDDPDFIYISEILRASQHLRDDSTVFFSIEKQLYNSNTTTTVSKRHQKLIFDVILEMLDRNRQLPPWKASIKDSRNSVRHIWNEFQRIREMAISNTGTGDGLVELISCVLKKDLVEVKDWDEYPMDTSEVILDTERLIFKDLVSEMIRDVGEYSDECKLYRSRRKLVF